MMVFTMKLNEFLETIRAEEISFYEDEVNKYHTLNSRRPEFEPKNNSDEEYTKWNEFIKNLQNLDNDIKCIQEHISHYNLM